MCARASRAHSKRRISILRNCRQLKQVARLISARVERKAERDVFFASCLNKRASDRLTVEEAIKHVSTASLFCSKVEIGGWDTPLVVQ